jgi:Fe-S-cluster-containing dehydrogenase component/DMSO reductase anchor subunit
MMGPPTAKEPLETLIDAFLAEQRQLTAVERFSQRVGDTGRPLLEPHYRALLPATPPGPGEQYAFEVDLDQCSSCKACVVACHSLNGLDAEESWREIRLLVGPRSGTSRPPAEPLALAVTSACHHCVDPGCLNGCPVLAYDKDPITGIVRHLDDQCIGCSYCIFTCPYEVPKFSSARGIVRKCDLCQGRLAVGEAPACVQACPNEAIRITRVSTSAVTERYRDDASQPGASDAGCSLPGMPPASLTLPSTVYRSRHSLDSLESRTLSGTLRPQEPHWPLIAMLVLTQWGGGALAAVGWRCLSVGATPSWLEMSVAAAGCLVLHAGLVASVFHLGQPLKAWRIGLGWRTSWLSREAIALGLLSGVSLLFTGLMALGTVPSGVPLPAWMLRGSAAVMILLLILATVAQIQVYAVTGRPRWRRPLTASRFVGTVALGAGVAAGFLAGGSATLIFGGLLLGLSVAERWQFFTGGISTRNPVPGGTP